MSYGNTWKSDAQVASDGLFAKKRDFSMLIHAMMSKNWSIVDHRQQAFDMWDGLKVDHPVAHNVQFPEFVSYVALENCDFAKVDAQLKAAMSYKESSKHRNEPAKQPEKSGLQRITNETGHTEGMVVSFSSDDDARKAYYEALRTFVTIARDESCVYTRSSFETKYNLTWA
jgi:hypothetical protein